MPDDDAAPDTTRGDRLVLAAGALLLVVITAFQVLPGPARWGSHVAPNDGDPVLITWILEHQARALLDDPGSIYQGNIFFPETAAIAWSDNVGAFVAPYLLVWLATGRSSVLAYNAVTLLAFAGSSLAVLLLARRLLRSPVAAVVAATAFSLAMVRRSAIGHTQLAGFLFLPLALVLVMDVVDRRRLRSALLAGACLAGLWYTAIYFFLLAVVVVPVFALVWAVTHRSEVDRRLLVLVAATSVTTALLIAPSLPPYLELQRRATFARSDDELITIGPGSFTQPPSLLYRVLDQDDGSTEGTDGFVGWAVVALAAVALGANVAQLARRRRIPAESGGAGTGTGAAPAQTASAGAERAQAVLDRRRRFGFPLAAACLTAGLLALGPGGGPLSVPYRVLRPLVPGFESARVLSRFWVLPAMGVALLAGRGLELLAGGRRRPLAVGTGALVVALLLAELFVRPGFSEVDVGPELVAVNEALAGLDPGVVTELPVPTLPEYPYALAARQLRSLEDGLARVEGYSGEAPAGLPEYLQATSSFPADDAIAAMRQAGVRHVVLHGADEACVARYGRGELAAILAQAAASPAVEEIARVGDEAIVTLTRTARGGPLTEIPAVPPLGRTTVPCERN